MGPRAYASPLVPYFALREIRLGILRTMFRRALAGSSAALALFHAWLFSGQALAGELADPGLLVRWLAAFGIVGGLILLRRRGQSLRGRKAVAIWLLAALLHGPAVANQIGTTGSPAVPDLAAVLVQLAVASAAAVILHLLVRWPRAKAQRPSRRPAVGLVSGGSLVGVLSTDAFLRITPRPPPRS